MKVLIIGSGGREHAIAYKLSQSSHVSKIFAIPGNPGIAKLGECHDYKVDDLEAILKFVEDYNIDLTVVGPEVPLCLGLVDLLEDNGHKAFGPRKKAATLEGSKVYAKQFMKKHNIPTANSIEVNSYAEAINALQDFSFPVVIKADGLAAGKGVVICNNVEEALMALDDMLNHNSLNGAGKSVVIEEFLEGFECSLLCFLDGNTIKPMVYAKDHKQIYDGNLGPNTGGMGTVSPNPLMSSNIDEILNKSILEPFMLGLKKDNIDYRGVIFIGLMIKDNQAKVLEFNVRFGDPETQVILLRLESDLYEIMDAVSSNRLNEIDVKWNNLHSVCVVLASKGYPSSYEKGKEITGLDSLEKEIVIFHAGTKICNEKLLTNGGRVLNVCALGNSLDEALKKAYNAASKINFQGKYYRKDIGLV